MAEVAASATKFTARSREADVARAALLDAARRVAAREGVDRVKLSVVADEADIARTTAYGYFRSRFDLLQSVVAEDLNLLTRAIRESAGLPEPSPTPPSRVVRSEFREPQSVEALEAAPGETPSNANDGKEAAREEHSGANERASPAPLASTDESRSHEDTSSTSHASEVGDNTSLSRDELQPLTYELDESDAVSEHDESPVDVMAPETESDHESGGQAAPSEVAVQLERRLPERDERIRLVGKRILAPELRENVNRLAPVYAPASEFASEAITRLEEAVAKLDSGFQERLERRLANLERNVSALEERAAQSGENHSSELVSLRAGYAKLDARLAAAGGVQQDTMLKMMVELREVMRRLDALDPPHESDGAHEIPAPAADTALQPDEGHEREAVEADANASTAEREPLTAAAADSYLSAARRAAMSSVANELADSARLRADRRRRQSRLGLAGAGIAVLCLAGIAMSFHEVALKSQGNPVHSPNVRFQTRAAAHSIARRRSTTATALTPVDRLSADARAGNPQAELAVGLKYLNGDGIAKNESEGAQWIARAALAGEPDAEGWLGTLYQRGRGVVADPAKGLSWLEKAAAQGNRKAMHDLAVSYAQGTGVTLNYFEAARWFSRAAALGYVDSQFNLAVLYERGDGVPQSLLAAYKWYAIAAAAGDQESRTRMTAIASGLAPDDLAAAQNAASSFKPVASVNGANLVARDAAVGAQ